MSETSQINIKSLSNKTVPNLEDTMKGQAVNHTGNTTSRGLLKNHVAFQVLDTTSNQVSSVNPPITIYPGQTVKLTGMSQVIEGGVLVCEEKLRSVVSTVKPALNKAGFPTLLQDTSFALPDQHGDVEWGFNNNINPVTFAVWDPGITSYNFTMKGQGCVDYIPGTQTVTFTLNVQHFSENALTLNATQSVCPPVSYDPVSNTAGLIGENPAFSGQTGCSIVYSVQNAPYSVQFGFLQTVSAGAFGSITNKTQSNSMEALFEESITVDCFQDAHGHYKTIASTITVPAGSSADVVYTNDPSFSAAPYYAATCDLKGAHTKSDTYAYYDLHYGTYLMMRTLSGDDAAWVPVRKAVWGIDTLHVACNNTKACGTGGVSQDGEVLPYVNTDWIASGTSTAPVADASWISNAVPPAWSDVFQDSYDVTLVQNQPDAYWFFCPATSAGAADTHDIL